MADQYRVVIQPVDIDEKDLPDATRPLDIILDVPQDNKVICVGRVWKAEARDGGSVELAVYRLPTPHIISRSVGIDYVAERNGLDSVGFPILGFRQVDEDLWQLQRWVIIKV